MDNSLPFSQNKPDFQANTNHITVDVVRNFDDLNHAFQIRRDIFVNEKHIPEEAEFDGNDFASTHILAKCDNQPAGTLRIRCFKDFAKMERLCVRSQFRGQAIASCLLDYTEFYLIQKGYTSFTGYILSSLKDFWTARGFQINENAPAVSIGQQTLLPCIYPFKPENIVKHSQKIDLLAKESQIRTYS